jgi:ADP-ribose pyrophosphatase
LPPHGADLTEHRLDSRQVYDGRLLDVREDRVRLPDGSVGLREYIVHPGAVVVVPVFDDGRLLLERQFRYPVGQHMIELPAGRLESGEAPLLCAKRELLEETGYTARDWSHLATTLPCVGYADERIELFLARGLHHVGHPGEDGEFVEAFALALDEALEWVRDGRITEAKAQLGILWAERTLRGRW